MVRLAVALLLVLAACGSGPQEWSRPYEGYLPHTEHDRFAVVLVRDKRTGRPIPGASFRAHPEMELGPRGWATPRAETTTDEFGLAWIPRFEGEGDFHWAVDAEGYAPTEEYGTHLSETVDLVPGADRSGRILDVYGRPIPNLRVEYKEGCAHSPALRSAVTDQKGGFTLRCIGDAGDVPLEGKAIRAEYWRAIELSTKGEPVAEFHGLPDHEVTGQILDAQGKPAAGAGVHGYTSWRGPTTTAGPDGRFTLRGAERGAMLGVHHRGEDTLEEFSGSDYRQDGPILLRLGQKALEPETVKVDVDVIDAVSQAPCDEVPVHFVRESDGRRFSGRSDEGEAWIRLPPGPYLLSAGAPYERYVAPAQRVEVEPHEDQRLALSVEQQPTLHIVLEDLPEDADSWLIHNGYCFAEDPHHEPESHHLPHAAEAVIVTEAWGRRKVFQVHAAAGGVRKVVLDWGGERPRQV
ncbi:MAG: carboxypeptidase-like regulatory domain-containing protein, partial [Planctomycetota bacterium]